MFSFFPSPVHISLLSITFMIFWQKKFCRPEIFRNIVNKNAIKRGFLSFLFLALFQRVFRAKIFFSALI